jgi:hypothetical protein
MQEAKVFRFVLAFPILEARLQEAKGSHHVCLHKGFGAKYGAVHVRLGSEVHYRIKGFFAKQLIQKSAVLDCAMDESVSCCRVWGKILKIGKIASVSQSIKVDNTPVGSLGKNMANEVCPNKTGTAGD